MLKKWETGPQGHHMNNAGTTNSLFSLLRFLWSYRKLHLLANWRHNFLIIAQTGYWGEKSGKYLQNQYCGRKHKHATLTHQIHTSATCMLTAIHYSNSRFHPLISAERILSKIERYSQSIKKKTNQQQCLHRNEVGMNYQTIVHLQK